MTAPLPLEQAQARLLELARALPIERLPVGDSLGRYLAEPLIAGRSQPAADLSAMDGYALQAGDLPGPWQVIGESAAGHPFGMSVAAGEAVRISTGAVLPTGADMVLLQEDCLREGDRLILTGTPPQPADRHLRRKAGDFALGAHLLASGERLTPARIGLVLAAGQAQVAVRRRPRLCIIDSGDELVSDPDACAVHQIPASNGAVLSAMASALACDVTRLGPVPDTLEALANALAAAKAADVIVTSGGASVGDHDLVRPALEAWGAKLDFWRIAIKPGKPLLVATRGSQIVLGLPGNPVSSMVTAYLFLLPLLRAMAGSNAPLPRAITAQLTEDLSATGDRREFLRAVWDGESVRQQRNQDSGALAAMAGSNALIDRPAHAPPAMAGTRVPVFLLENGGIA